MTIIQGYSLAPSAPSCRLPSAANHKVNITQRCEYTIAVMRVIHILLDRMLIDAILLSTLFTIDQAAHR
jgi:hypothetical protein